jgi:hypothetical protein
VVEPPPWPVWGWLNHLQITPLPRSFLFFLPNLVPFVSYPHPPNVSSKIAIDPPKIFESDMVLEVSIIVLVNLGSVCFAPPFDCFVTTPLGGPSGVVVRSGLPLENPPTGHDDRSTLATLLVASHSLLSWPPPDIYSTHF